MAKASVADKPAKQSTKTKADKPGLFQRLGLYFRGVRAELKRVVWPDGPEVRNSVFVVIVTLLFFVAFTLLIEQVTTQVLALIDRIGG